MFAPASTENKAGNCQSGNTNTSMPMAIIVLRFLLFASPALVGNYHSSYAIIWTHLRLEKNAQRVQSSSPFCNTALAVAVMQHYRT
eukprot:scaffold34935_cov189-Amphora_coffeaeformis.AAC.6